jgi:ATP-dependent RNA helicase RhlE
MSFSNYAIDPRCLSVLDAQRLTEPTPIQAEVIPVALTGRDVVAVAQTGTGKTLAFTLPSLTRLAQGPKQRNMMLVLTPTRELALQVHAVIREYGKAVGIRSTCIYGGVGFDNQTRDLKRGVGVIVATPGRLLDHMGRGNIAFRDLQILVLDEADRMLDMGFLPDIRRILQKLPSERQTLMSSATFPGEIARLAREMQNNAVQVSVGAVAKPVDKVRQVLYTVQRSTKTSLLVKILRHEKVGSALIFLRTKHRTDSVAKSLKKEGFKAAAIHGDRSQSQRQQALDGFRQGRYSILVATDVAARGLDIDGISHVVNFDIPGNAEDYIHRIGRTARADAEGDAITFVSPGEHLQLEAIERNLGKNLPRADWESQAPVLSLFTPDDGDNRGRRANGFRRRRSLLKRR